MSEVYFGSVDLVSMPRIYRANLVNSITGYKPAMLIGTHNGNGQLNLAIFSSIVHLGADPALIGFIQRPVGVSGDTFRNIMSTGEYTINHVHQEFIEKAHFTSAKVPADLSEFELCKLTSTFIPGFSAPFVAESKIKMGLNFIEAIPITHNQTTLVIGKMTHLIVAADAIGNDGNLSLSAVQSVCISGLENYHQVQPLASFPYARLENIPSF
jgi:flavin reductase (DIM6/NTAB) family NADH-FMN oxidoreductase RutF